MDSQEELLHAKKLILQYQQEMLDLYQIVNNWKCSLFDMHQKYLSMKQKFENEKIKTYKLQIEIERLINNEHHVSCGEVDDDYIPKIGVDYRKQKHNIVMNIDIMKNHNEHKDNFYQSKTYQNYMKLKLLVKGKVKCCRLKGVCNVFDELLNKKFNISGKMVQHTERRTADKLIQLKLHDLCMIETAYCIHHFFGPQSVFDLLHDESTDGISFLLAALSFKPDYNDEDIYVPKLLSGNIVKVICSQELSDKTANSAVYQALLPAVNYLNWIGYKLYGNAWTDLIPLMQKHMNAVTDENTTAISTSHMFFKVCCLFCLNGSSRLNWIINHNFRRYRLLIMQYGFVCITNFRIASNQQLNIQLQ